jgi:phosphodiesterase/alkaline phosphatase D-like protein
MTRIRQLWCFLVTLPYQTSSHEANSHDLNLRGDTAHTPFLHGVGSADPLTDSVLIWTRVSQSSITQLQWSVWAKNDKSQSFKSPFQAGNTSISEISDYATTVEVKSLESGTSYYYQFQTPDGRKSRVGTTQTASTSSTIVNVAILSCTSLWSGYFNMYRQLSNDKDIDVVVHLGDIIYTDIDPDEMYRVPYGLCQDWTWFKPSTMGGTADDNHDTSVRDLVATLRCANMTELERFRWIYNLYLLDPDFRDARANHPWIVALDNHDLVGYSADPSQGSRQASLEWIPQRVTIEETDEGELFVNSLRSFRFGDELVDVIMLDTHSFSGNATIRGNSGLLGDEQHQWLNEVLINSTVVNWRLFGSGKTFMPFTLNKLSSAIVLPCILVTLILLILLLTCVCSEVYLLKQNRYEIIRSDPKNVLLVFEDSSSGADSQETFKNSIQTFTSARNLSLHALSWGSCFSLLCLILWVLIWIAASFFLHDLMNPNDNGLTYLNAHEYTWEGHPECEMRLFDQLEATRTDHNNFWATGDMHFSYAADVVRYNPYGKDLLDYFPQDKCVKRYGVEMTGGSGTRGNLDEKVGELFHVAKPGGFLSTIVSPISNYIVSCMNRHYRYFDGQQHGYGKVTITRASVVTQFLQFPILQKTDDYHVGMRMFVESGKNQWSDGRQAAVLTSVDTLERRTPSL